VSIVFSVCTGALICGAAGLLKGRRATTHWAALHLLPYFGSTPVDDRVVVNGNLVCAAGVTAGIDGALKVAAILRGETAAEAIELYMQYPEPPFNAGAPKTAPGGNDRCRAGCHRRNHGAPGEDGLARGRTARHRASP
jgi:cyclohexyl-isocyanide hydratase